ncbi:hypothetical protein AMK59_204, partial [Oryctes borbonicus]
MLAAMTTVTTGLLSPNSYGLNPDKVAATMAASNADSDYERYRNVPMFARTAANTTATNSSDSETDAYTRSPKSEAPKRNKRKNFKPRCSNISYSDNENEVALNLSEFSNNNNLKNISRRKTLSTRKLVADSRYSPMDLSKANESDSPSDESEFGEMENFDEDDNENGSSETDSKVSSSFSIQHLSKPHVSDYGASSGLAHG